MPSAHNAYYVGSNPTTSTTMHCNKQKGYTMSIIELSQDIETMEEFEPLPNGPYPAELQDVEIRHSEKVPQGYLYCQFHISPDHFPADYDEGNAPEGLTVVYSSVAIPDPNNRRTVRPFNMFMKALGVKLKGSSFETDKLIGKNCQLILKRNEYQGALVNNVEAVQEMPAV